MKVKLLDLVPQYESIRDEVRAAMDEVFETQQFVLGPKVAELEERIASYCGVRRAVGVASGSDAILLSLMALGVGPGDEVITTPYTFFSTVSAITRLGARPVFVDIDPRTYNISPDGLGAALTGSTRAVIVVHLYGQTADMDPIMESAGGMDVPVIEDACQSIGALYRGRKAGSIGTAGCFSFFPTKNLGGFGDGGMVVTGDGDLADRIAALRVHGGTRRYYHDEVGVNSRLDALQAAVLCVKLAHLESWNEARRRNAAFYNGALSHLGGVTVPYIEPRNTCTFNQYVIRADRRDGLKRYLADNGVGSEIYYPLPLHLQHCFSFLGGKEGDFPEAERAARETLALPVYPELTDGQLAVVAGAIEEFVSTGAVT